MGKKQLKFLSISEAPEELKNTLMMLSEVKKQGEVQSLLARIENFDIRKDVIKAHPLDLVDRHGVWIRTDGNGKFYYGVDLVEFLMDLLKSKPLETIAEVYSRIEWVDVKVERHPETGVAGLLIETEMEKFECARCGHCCLDLSDAYQASVPDSDVLRWKCENRSDILAWVARRISYAG
jgi:hypothetical protein